ncbi:MAG: rhamnulokinase, partial [Lachnospiraceae bacterium]|nr:rhamnulokinase [Lachnospiraceae bacterium]
AVKDFCRKSGQTVPETLPQLASVIYNSLANCYADKLKGIEEITGKKYGRIHIIGGGSNARYLNELTAKYTGADVYAGPGEATAIGNLMTQMIKSGDFNDLAEAREAVLKSFGIEVFKA